jgi:amino acid adenylation domain-containing protein
LSFAQQRLWTLWKMSALGPADQIQFAVRLTGDLDGSALRRALDRVVLRHEGLRAKVVYLDDRPVQQVADDDIGFPLEEHDLRGRLDIEAQWRLLAAEDRAAPFDLQTAPLARGRLIRVADGERILLVSVHAIACDEWSIDVFKRELGVLYRAFRNGQADPLPPLAMQYPDFSVWQRRRLSGDYLESLVDYWRRALAGDLPVLELPTDRRRPAKQDYKADRVGLEFEPSATAALRALCARRGTTLFAALLAAWAALLARLSGQSDVIVGAPAAYRLRPEVEPLIGPFANEAPLRIDLSGEPSVGELIDRVARTVREAHEHEDVRLEQILERLQLPRSMAREPLFQSTFVWRDSAAAEMGLDGLEVTSLEAPARYVRFDLTLRLEPSQGRIVGGLDYATALFDRPTIERYAGYLSRIVEGMAAGERQVVDRLPLIGEAERRRLLVEWNATGAAYPEDKCLHELIEAQAERTPDAVAVVFEDKQLSYAELNSKANVVARRLRAIGVRPDDRVAIFVRRSLDMLIGLIAILKSGGAYVPLDPGYPPARLGSMLDDSAPAAVLSHGEARQALEAALAGLSRQPPVLDLDGDLAASPGAPAANPKAKDVGLTPRSLAYVIYTSGSTGKPKGVMVEHRALVNCLSSMRDIVGIEASDRVLALTTIGFDIAGVELFLPLVCGARTVIADQCSATDPERIGAIIEREGVTVVQATPATWRMLVDAVWPGKAGLKALSGGEALPSALAAQIVNRVGRLINVYGPTETTIWSSSWAVVDPAPTASACQPIGRPIANTRIHILDKRLEPVPTGVAGEIYIGGDGVARGYLNRADLTDERFVADPFAAGGRLYRTGDLGRRRADGAIEFLGRADFQVKIRGFRIELGEIEARLEEHPRVREAVAAAREDWPGEARLAAYYTATDDQDIAVEALREHVAGSLPGYMVPAAYVRLPALPLTANRKVDRKALPAPEADAYAVRPYEPARGATEEALAKIFAAALKIERVGRDDNFFELGGDSLLGIRVVFEIEKTLGRKLATASLFSSPTAAELAAALGLGGEVPNLLSLVPLHTRGSGAPIFMIHLIERELARHLGRRRPVYGLSYGLAAVGADGDVRLPRDTEAAASHYIEEMRSVQPRGPYRLLGHSLGGQIAYEMAQQLHSEGETVEFLGLIDTDPPGHGQRSKPLPMGKVIKNVMRTSPARLLRLVNNALNRNTFVRRTKIRFLPTDSSFQFRLHDLTAVPYWPKPYGGRIDIFQATIPEPYIRREPPPPVEVGWRKLALGDLAVHPIPGGHLEVVKDPVAATSAAAMDAVLIKLDVQASQRPKKEGDVAPARG